MINCLFLISNIYIFVKPPNRLAHVGSEVCALAPDSYATSTCLLVCFINGKHLSKCFSKIVHQDFMAKTIYFS